MIFNSYVCGPSQLNEAFKTSNQDFQVFLFMKFGLLHYMYYLILVPGGLFSLLGVRCNLSSTSLSRSTVSRSGLMVSALDSASSGPGLGPGRGHCVVFLGKTLYSHGASLHPGV